LHLRDLFHQLLIILFLLNQKEQNRYDIHDIHFNSNHVMWQRTMHFMWEEKEEVWSLLHERPMGTYVHENPISTSQIPDFNFMNSINFTNSSFQLQVCNISIFACWAFFRDSYFLYVFTNWNSWRWLHHNVMLELWTREV
jgi:hypothetical protein